MKNKLAIFIILISTLSLLLSACGPAPTPSPTLTPPPTNSPVPPTPTLPPTATAVSLSELTLKQGDFYFSVDGKPSFILSRNITGKTKDDFDTLLEWAHQGGTKVIRVHLTHGWWGDPWINKDWSVDEKWVQDWDSFFDQAQADGIFIIPVFGVWADWNNGKPDWGSPFWQYNPLNTANGGLVSSPDELFQPDSTAQQHWMTWVKTLVEHWQGRKNIAAWEIFSEINIASGGPVSTDPKGEMDEATGVDFTNKAMAIIHAADPQHRPVTLSLAGVYSPNDQWSQYYNLDSLDFIEIHPYSDTLDRELVKEVQQYRNQYQKPVIIGESGLWSMATKANASIGIKHAIWAGLVSGSMNGRALWGNDGYSIYSTDDHALAFQFMQTYATTELPAAHFVSGIDFSGFKPLEVTTSSDIWGAAVGNENSILGWFRDESSEPPDWNLQPTISKQSVTITIPGSASNWKVDFYDTKDGITILSSNSANATGNTITVSLPDFHDDIAFKAYAQ
jgi:Glycosyl hydrolase catalytic core